MLRDKLRKIASVALCASMVLTFQLPTMALAEGEAVLTAAADQGAATTVVSADYRSQDAGALFDDGKITVSGSGVTVSKDETSGNVVFSGKRSAMRSSCITIDKQFDFDQAPVGRFSFSGLAAAGKKIVLGFYLDDQAEPFCKMQLKCQTNAGEWINPMAVTTNVIEKNITGKHALSIKVEECSSEPSFCINSVEFAQSSVPIVNISIDESLGTIDAMNNSDSHTARCYGSISITVPTGCTSVFTGKELKGTDELELSYIRGRGNSTWTVDKKPYRFKLDSGEDLLGMGKNKNWALMACAFDDSLMRNTFTSILGQKIGMEYTPNMEPVEVVMNGSYLGCYTLSELTATGNNRVEITVNDDSSSTGEDTGYLLSLGNWSLDEGKLNFTTKKAEGVFQIESPSAGETGNMAQYEYIKNYVQQVEDAIYAHDTDTYSKLMDLTAAARYYLVEELSNNGDGFTSGSCYLYKDVDGKLCWGPIWDFDLAWGNGYSPDEAYAEWFQNSRFWNQELLKDDVYIEAIKAVWPEMKAALNSMCAEGGELDNVIQHFAVAGGYDREKWRGISGNDDSDEEEIQVKQPETDVDVFQEYLAYTEDLRGWALNRAAWVDKNLDTLQPQPTTITVKADGKVVRTVPGYIDCSVPELGDAPAKKGYVFMGWTYTRIVTLEDVLADAGCTEEEYRTSLIVDQDFSAEEADAYIEELRKGVAEDGEVNEYSTVFKDMVVEAKYVPADEIGDVQIFTFRDTLYGVYDPDDSSVLTLDYTMTPANAGISVKFVSSDESVIASDTTKFLRVKGPGDATVTIVPSVGEPKVVKIHVYTLEEYRSTELPWPGDNTFDVEKVTISKGEYYQVPIGGYAEGSVIEDTPSVMAFQESVVETYDCGVIYGAEVGSTFIYFTDCYGNLRTCNVTVVDPDAVPASVKVGGLKYKVLTSTKSSRTVACAGPVSKTLTKATVRNTVKIKGKSYKVTEIASNAFKNCKSLKTVSLPSNLQIVGAGAFMGCKKLTKVTFSSKNKPKVYSTAFKSVSKKIKYYVPKSQKAYYQLVLGKKNVKVK